MKTKRENLIKNRRPLSGKTRKILWRMTKKVWRLLDWENVKTVIYIDAGVISLKNVINSYFLSPERKRKKLSAIRDYVFIYSFCIRLKKNRVVIIYIYIYIYIYIALTQSSALRNEDIIHFLRRKYCFLEPFIDFYIFPYF